MTRLFPIFALQDPNPCTNQPSREWRSQSSANKPRHPLGSIPCKSEVGTREGRQWRDKWFCRVRFSFNLERLIIHISILRWEVSFERERMRVPLREWVTNSLRPLQANSIEPRGFFGREDLSLDTETDKTLRHAFSFKRKRGGKWDEERKGLNCRHFSNLRSDKRERKLFWRKSLVFRRQRKKKNMSWVDQEKIVVHLYRNKHNFVFFQSFILFFSFSKWNRIG